MTTLPDPYPVPTLAESAGPVSTAIAPPGSKSVTNRCYVLAALAEGVSHVRRPLHADDTDRLLAALESLGATVRAGGDDVVIEGTGGRLPRGGRIDLGDGGTPARFMIAVATRADDEVVVDGSTRMRERPVAGLVDLLRLLGASIDYVDAEGRLPVRVRPATMRGGVLDVPPTPSSQFISALMLVGPTLPDGLELRLASPVTSRAYLELTRRVMRSWNVDVDFDGDTLRIAPGRIAARVATVEPDASSAVYWLTAAAMVPGVEVTIEGLGTSSAQPDAAYADVLARAGVDVTRGADHTTACGPPALRPVHVDMSGMPDAALAVAVLAARCEGVSVITGLETLPIKETDRIAALATELRRIGCEVETTDGSLRIDPAPAHDDPAEIATYRDHRMAMAFAVLGLARPGLAIKDPACVTKSYPGFWEDLRRLHAAAAPSR